MAVLTLHASRPRRRKSACDSINVPPGARMAAAHTKYAHDDSSFIKEFNRKNPQTEIVQRRQTEAEKDAADAVLEKDGDKNDLFQEQFIDLRTEVYLGLTRALKEAPPEQQEKFITLQQATQSLKWWAPTRKYLNGNIKRLQDIRNALDHMEEKYTPRDAHAKLAWLMCGMNEISLASFAERITTNDSAMQRMFDARIQKLVPDMENRFREAEQRASERAEKAEEEASIMSEQIAQKTLDVVRAYSTKIDNLHDELQSLIMKTEQQKQAEIASLVEERVAPALTAMHREIEEFVQAAVNTELSGELRKYLDSQTQVHLQVADIRKEMLDFIQNVNRRTDLLQGDIETLNIAKNRTALLEKKRTDRKNRPFYHRYNPLGADANAADALPALLARL